MTGRDAENIARKSIRHRDGAPQSLRSRVAPHGELHD
ncbi:uncharacterized protein METZ01_LOCUS350149, partial [marine metagenome]